MPSRILPWPVDLIDSKEAIIRHSKRIVSFTELALLEMNGGNPYFSDMIIPEIERKAQEIKRIARLIHKRAPKKRGQPAQVGPEQRQRAGPGDGHHRPDG